MRQKIMVALVVGLLFVVTKVAVAEECVIDGYLPEQFSVKGIVERKAKECIARLQQSSVTEGGRLVISIIGSADASGKSHNNYLLAKSRAEKVGEIVSDRFPKALVKNSSAGDNENLRQVKVVFVHEALVPRVETSNGTKQQEQIVSSNYYLVFPALVLCAVGLAFVAYKMPTRQTKAKEDEVLPQQEVETEIITIGEYEIQIKIHDRFYWSPFVSINGNDIKRKSFSDIRRSIIGCLKDPQFASQKELLIENGIIKMGAN